MCGLFTERWSYAIGWCLLTWETTEKKSVLSSTVNVEILSGPKRSNTVTDRFTCISANVVSLQKVMHHRIETRRPQAWQSVASPLHQGITESSDERLTLEKSASESLYGGQFTLSTKLIKPNYLTTTRKSQQKQRCKGMRQIKSAETTRQQNMAWCYMYTGHISKRNGLNFLQTA